MRSGRILAEGSPQEMTSKFNSGSLEDVFYKICITSELKENENPSRYLKFSSVIEERGGQVFEGT